MAAPLILRWREINVAFLLAQGATDIGQRREHNEDRIFCDPNMGLFVVCDGMGGHAAGEVAAEMVVESIVHHLEECLSELPDHLDEEDAANQLGNALEQGIMAGNAAVHARGQAEGHQGGIGTTCTALVVHGRRACLGHVGDSRCYLVRDEKLYQLSQDHSWVAEMVRTGRMTVEEAERSPQRNLLVRSVGPQPVVKVDRLSIDLVAHDTLLLCSDGLHSYFSSPSELVELLERGDVSRLPEELIGLGNSRGGHDNLSAVLVRMPSADDLPPSDRDPRVELAFLGSLDLFSEMGLPELVRVRSICSHVTFEADEPICREGAVGDSMYVLLSGSANVLSNGQVLTDLSPGDHVGEMSLVDARPRSATVISHGESRWLRIARGEIFRVVRQEPELAVKLLWNFVRVLSSRLRDTNAALQTGRGLRPLAGESLSSVVGEASDSFEVEFSIDEQHAGFEVEIDEDPEDY
ncbi:MAG: hypothetical protein CMH55_00175 [Myxococcales bacterium]|nr:hypothetical protein [Myxococcales bacterium]